MTAKRKVLPESAGWSLAEAARQKVVALAELLQLELATKRGDLVRLADIRPAWSRVVLALRSGMLAIPSKLRLQMPHLSAQDIETIRECIREALTTASVTDTPPAIESAMTNEQLAAEVARLSTGSLWQLANEIMDEGKLTGAVDAGHLSLVDACLAELGHRQPELFDTPEFDEFLALVAEKLAALPPVGHA